MNRSQARAFVSDTFTHGFDKPHFRTFVHNLLNHFDESKAAQWTKMRIKDAFKDHVQWYERLGTYTTPNGEKLDVLIVHLTTDSKLERARTSIRNFVADHLKTRDEKDAALVAFVSPSENSWRFSYIRMEYATVQAESGKVGVEARLTPARRFSYIVGEGESCHTAQSRFLNLLANDSTDPALAQIEEAFSVEAVTKEFFEKYAELFGNIHAALDKLAEKNKAIRDEFARKGVQTVDFAKKLMGQIVFLYFLQKKGWLGVERGKAWGTGPHDLLRKMASGAYGEYKNFFNDILEPLFYDTLASDRGHEAWCDRFKCRIPFLNGGLFEPLGDYDWRSIDIPLPNELFTNAKHIEEGVTGSGVLDVFDRYNFTVNEAEPLEQEVAIDPEMLGKVFENLIEENRRKGLGAFYTPREIVHYMCQQSLINYLDTTLNSEISIIDREDIEAFILHGEQFSFYEAAKQSGTIGKHYPSPPKSIAQHARLIDERLEAVKVCDPAVGSGAFPVGIMHEIVRARTSLTPYFNDVRERSPYSFKRNTIHNSLYGVDIDPGAVEIAKLRLWLSLVVDEEETKQIKPLPNLDYKIVVGNSLLALPFKTHGLREVEALKQLFFDESDRHTKANLKEAIDKRLNECFASSKRSLGYEVSFDFEICFSEVFSDSGGFNIVIGNPPYVRVHKQDAQQKKVLKQLYKSPVGDFDIYVVFIEKGIQIARGGGVICLITPDKFLIREYGVGIRAIILEHRLVELYDISRADDAFGAAVYPLITTIQKALPMSYTRVRFAKSVKKIDAPLNEYLYPQADWQRAKLIEMIEESDLKLLKKITNGTEPLSELLGPDAMFCGTPRAKDYYAWADGLVSKPKKKTPKVLVCSNLGPYAIDHGKAVRTLGQKIEGPYFDNSGGLIGEGLWKSFSHVPKILIRGNDTRVTAALDNEPSVFIGVYGIKLSAKTAPLARLLLALLNSTLYQWVFLTRNPSLKIGGGFFSINSPQVLALPFKEPGTDSLRTINRLVDKVIEHRKVVPKGPISEYERRVDQAVYSMFGLTEDEIKRVEAEVFVKERGSQSSDEVELDSPE
jgi:type I restriction-modification system DNA methylase subunit